MDAMASAVSARAGVCSSGAGGASSTATDADADVIARAVVEFELRLSRGNALSSRTVVIYNN
jgi:hypothetical protein